MFGMRDIRFGPQGLIEPMTLFDPSASVFNHRELSLSAVHVNWDDTSVCYQNLRKLELKNQTHDAGPSFEELAEILSSSPRLEYLDVSGFCPEHHTDPRSPGAWGPCRPSISVERFHLRLEGRTSWPPIPSDVPNRGLVGTSYPYGHRIRLW
jgi:hypothetical protein